MEDGTAIGSAVASAANRLKDKEAKTKLIVLLSDGDSNAGRITPATGRRGGQGPRHPRLRHRSRFPGGAPGPMLDAFGRKVRL